MKAKRGPQSKIRKRDRSATEAALLDSAMDLFSKQGFDATTTKQIALRAKANEQLIQRYFGGKDGLLIAILKNFRTRALEQDPFEKLEGIDLKGDLRKLLEEAPAYFAERGDLMRIGFSQALLNPKIGEIMHRKMKEELIPENVKRMSQYQTKGWIDPELDLWSVTYGLMLVIFGIGFTGQFVHRMKSEDLKRVANELGKILARGLAPREK